MKNNGPTQEGSVDKKHEEKPRQASDPQEIEQEQSDADDPKAMDGTAEEKEGQDQSLEKPSSEESFDSNPRFAVCFREFRHADLDALYFLCSKFLPPPARRSYGVLTDVLLHPHVGAMLAEVEDAVDPEIRKIVGALVIYHEVEQERLVMDTLVVEPLFRRRGIGRRFLAWGTRAALGQGRNALYVPVDDGSPEAESFLKATGFAVDIMEEAEEDTKASMGPFSKDRPGKMWRKSLDETEKS